MPKALTGTVQWLGAYTLSSLRYLLDIFSLFYGAIAVLVFVRTRGVRVVLDIGLTQTKFTGVHGLPLVSLAALALGTLIIIEVNSYPVDAAVVATDILVRDVIPLVVAIILIGRSGTAIAVELANMKLSGELEAVQDMGIPLEHFIVLPRLVAVVLSSVVLTVYGIAVGIGASYYLAQVVDSLPFALQALLAAIDTEDIFIALSKAALFGAAIVLVSIREGYSVRVSRREIPQATTRAVVYCMSLVLVLNTSISLFV